MKTAFKNKLQLLDYYKDENTCRELLASQRWPEGVKCPHCGHGHVYTTNRGYKCANKECHKKFTVITKTIFENTKIPLRVWYSAIYVITAHKKGISSHQLARDLGCTQKTAWFINHRVREMLKESQPELLDGEIELDESYFGGKEKNKHVHLRAAKTPTVSLISKGRSKYVVTDTKVPVFGILQRDGVVRAKKVENTKGKTLIPIMVDNVSPTAYVYSDEHTGYFRLAKTGFNHQKVNHKIGEYVRGQVHTNGIENFWSLFKRGVIGIYHHVSEKHIDRYCVEFSYRYNSRKITDQERFFGVLKQTEKRLKYEDLIKE